MPSAVISRFVTFGCRTSLKIFLISTLLLRNSEAIENSTSTTRVSRLRNCGPLHDLCSRRHAEKINATDHKSKGCLCDAKCSEFGDCCFDAAFTTHVLPSNRWTCELVNRNVSVFVVSSCENPTNHSVGNYMCSSLTVNSSFYDYMMDVPVFSNSSGKFFKNFYCALCNSQDASDLTEVRLNFHCNTNSSTFSLKNFIEMAKYRPKERLWTLGAERCFFEPSYPSSQPGHGSRHCWPSVDRCPSQSIISPDFSDLCSKYQQPVYAMKTPNDVREFKNPHCAVCNGFSTGDLACRKPGTTIHKTLKTKLGSSIVLPSLSMIVDINFQTCDFPLVWDGLRNECRLLFNTSKLSSSRLNSTRSVVTALDIVSSTRVLQGYLSSTCVILSVASLLLHILKYHIGKSAPVTLPSKTLYSLAWSLLLSQVFFQLGVSPPFRVYRAICYASAVLVHFLFLLTFFWMNVMSFDVWRTFSTDGYRNDALRNHAYYTAYAFIGPLLIIAVAIAADAGKWLPEKMRPEYSALPNVCWFSSQLGAVVFLHVPALVLISVNTIFFVLTVLWFQKQKATAKILNKTPGRKDYVRFCLYVKLSTIMGIMWLSGALAVVTEIDEFWYPFILLNGLQGVFILLMFNPELFSKKITAFRGLFSKEKGKSFSKNGSVPSSKTSKTIEGTSISKFPQDRGDRDTKMIIPHVGRVI